MADGDIILKELENADREKAPKRIIYFANGETMEEYSTDEEEEEEEHRVVFQKVDTTKMDWGTFVRFWMLRVATTVFFTCEVLGGKLANLFGLNEPKYQYAIDEYHRTRDESEDEGNEDEMERRQTEVPDETHHLQTQRVEYGTIRSSDASIQTGDAFQPNAETQLSDSAPREQ
ncbi:protein FAM177B [Spea bombifrons]|uniref:protein FAM177B n=1 Tax=Spea bombifrons TaxID=233779 RepID=UPI002349D65A|nr:protein FAM177B [Spea bombifrons]